MTYSAIEIAKYIISYCIKNNMPISNLKLQKILYFVQAEFLVTKNKPCFYEDIEAWDFGPVIPVVYHKYEIFGSANFPYNIDCTINTIIANKDIELINEIIDITAPYSSPQLVSVTQKQSPWLQAYYTLTHNHIISNESIKEFFNEKEG